MKMMCGAIIEYKDKRLYNIGRVVKPVSHLKNRRTKGSIVKCNTKVKGIIGGYYGIKS